MMCRDCELLLSQDEIPVDARAHLNECAACRSLADEIAANAVVLREFRDEVLPFHAPAVAPAPRPSWKWAALIPAFLVLVAAVLLHRNASETLAVPSHVNAPKPLMVKMLTSDPNVVIYWQIDPAGQEQQ